ncbi:MAG: pyruvate:ferredoxin (flavodoxin) oxidoreductase [Firmicutes bacterium]|nr:pyruvate:ferredoxin (flavodoxin) oxidoreductase [Bacillota bacterium]
MSKQMKTMDGNKAAAYISYAFTEVAAIYPITPSSPMAEAVDEWSVAGKKNLFGRPVRVMEMESEAGAAGAVHGSLSSGSLTTTYTASQGLLLMIPNIYKMAGELLPGVLHVSARSLATHALNIFGDHSDVMACAQTGAAMLVSSNVQEVMDLAAVAHLGAISARLPFIHFFDGFRTSHEQQKIEVMDYEDLAPLIDKEALAAFRARALNPEHPVSHGTNQNPDIFFQAREAANPYFAAAPGIVADYLEKISAITGRDYKLFNYHGAPDAEEVLVAMGSVCDTAEQVVDHLNANGRKVGLIKVRLYRPFSIEHFMKVMPETVKRVAVIDRVKTPGAPGEPLFMDVVTAFAGRANAPLIIGGRYGLGSKDTMPADLLAVFDNLHAENPKHGFTISITDDVTNTSLPRTGKLNLLPEGTVQCKFWGLGSDGTVGANKQAVDIIGSREGTYAQAYFSYDSKKSGGVTVSHLRFGKQPIKAPYLINHADFISCSNQAYIRSYDVLEGLKDGGTFLFNCTWGIDELEAHLPAKVKRYIAEHNINFYVINAVGIAQALGLGNRTNMVMQSAFFALSGIMPIEEAKQALYDAINKLYGKKGADIVAMNCQAVDKGADSFVKVEVPAAWATAEDAPVACNGDPEFVKNILRPMAAQQGDKLPVSAFKDLVDGSYPTGCSKFEKRGVSAFVPQWDVDKCAQCNQCAAVCAHAAIRPVLLDEAEQAAAPEGFATKKATGKDLAGLTYRMQVSAADCLGCEACVKVCKVDALKMVPAAAEIEKETPNWDYAMTVTDKSDRVAPTNMRMAQFRQPLLEFSGACAGCGETPYAKLITQLFGSRMVVANATGCSSIWGAAAPAMPYCKNAKGQGPAWANSLFEDNAEFGLGILLGAKEQREQLQQIVADKLATKPVEERSEFLNALQEWLDNYGNGDITAALAEKITAMAEERKDRCEFAAEVYARRDQLVKKSFWCFGGDGWAYDIGFGGLDHVLASGEDINVLVFDTEVYSNTGGQSSKATPTAAIAKFAAGGKRTGKKDLGLMAMSYGTVYVAQIAMGADMNQTLKAIREAEAYPGPSLIVAYSTCIEHGIKGSMANAMDEMKKAVQCGYWQLFRYNPEAETPFTLDFDPDHDGYRNFITGERRYAYLQKQNPELADKLYESSENVSRRKLDTYKKLFGNK